MKVLSPELAYVSCSLLCGALGAVWDVRTRRIPNLLTGLSIATALLLHFWIGGWGQMGSAALAGLLGGGVFLIFYLAGGMGAGDVKLMAAVACFAGMSYVAQLLVATAVLGGVFAIALALYRGRLQSTFHNAIALIRYHGRVGLRRHPELNLSNAETLRLPYAIAIAAGCLAVWSSAIALR